MKNLYTIFLLVIAVLMYSSEAQAKNSISSTETITLNKAAKTIKAPDALSYKWYLNDELLEVSASEIAITEAGTYKVEMTDENGETVTSRIAVGINADGEAYRIILIGDSTVQAWGGSYYPQEGWGAILEYFFDDNVTVLNRARSARSARSYYYYDSGEEMNWQNTKELIQTGDFVFIGFGINDAATTYDRYTDPFDTNEYTGFKWYLRQYVRETKARGGIPVIVTTVRRCAFNDDGTVYDSYHDYPVASREVAEEMGLPCIDLDSASVPLYESKGYDYIAHFLHNVYNAGEYSNYPDGNSDMVHFQESGCIEICRLVTEEIQEYSTDTSMAKLISHLKPLYEVEVNTNTTNGEYGGLITRTASYPEGVNVTLKVIPDDGCDFEKWTTGETDPYSTGQIIQFTMPEKDTAYTAHFDYPPRLEILNPADGDELELGRDLILEVFSHNVSDTAPELIVYEGTTELVKFDTAPYIDTLIGGVASGEHTYTAKAYNIYGELMTSEAITFTVDDGYPHITLDSPTEDGTYQLEDAINFSATAYDSDGTLETVKFYLDGSVIATLTGEPYSYDLANPGLGSYSVYAVAIDNLGNSTQTDEITIDVGPVTTFQEDTTGYCGITDSLGSIDSNNEGFTGSGFVNTDNALGTVVNYTVNFVDTGDYKITFRYSSTATRPGDVVINGEEVGTVAMEATASYTDWALSSINYSCTETGVKPLSITATVSTGLPNIDYMKILSLTSDSKVEASSECIDQPEMPEISLVKPANKATYEFGDTIVFEATATDADGTVDTIKFYLNDEVIAVLTDGSYSYEMETPAIGTYTVYATATDNQGYVAQTDSRTIEVTEASGFITAEREENIKIYPVPARDYIVLNALNNKEITNVTIYSLDGSKMKSESSINSNSTEISCADMNTGIYIIQVTMGEENYFRKFSVEK